MIRTVKLTRRSNNMMEGVLQMSKTPNPEIHSSLQTWQCDQESGEYDTGAPGNLLGAQVAAVRLASSSPDSGPESDLLAPELHNLESGGSLLSNDMSSGNPTANFIVSKPSVWGNGDSEYSWPQESLSRSSGTMDDSSLLSNDTLGNDTSRLLESSKTGDSLIPHWPPNNSQSSVTSIQTSSQVPYQRRSWQSTSDGDHPSLGLLIPNMNLQAYSHSFPALSSASGFDAPKFSMDYYGSGERPLGNFEATSVYDSMARKIQNQMSGLDASSGSTTDMSSIGFSALPTSSPVVLAESSDNTVSSDLFSQHGLLQQRKNYGIGSGENGKNYLTSNSRGFFNQNSSVLDTNPIMCTTTASNQRFGANVNSPKLLLESLPGNSVLNNISPSESILGSQNYLYSSTQKKADPLESSRKWPTDAGVNVVTTGTGLKDFPGNNSGLDNPGRFSTSYTVILGDNEDGAGLYDSTSWTTASVGQQSNSVDLVPGEDSRKRFLHMSIGQPSENNSNKRLHMETQNGQTAIPPAPLKRSSSWASSLTSTCSKGQETSVIAGTTLPYTKSNSRHAVGPALNTNLKPRARQGSANDPQSIAARHRRERISERLKVLQDLVPNGSKVDLVTMLEKAINYVKFLQLQVKVLTTDDYWPSNEKGAAPCTALPNFEDMEGALKVLVAQAEKEANTSNNNGTSGAEKSPESDDMELGSPGSSESL